MQIQLYTIVQTLIKKVCMGAMNLRHHLFGLVEVNDRMIVTTKKHFDVAHHMLATYGWNTFMIDEHYDGSSLSLTEFPTLHEDIEIMMKSFQLKMK